MRTISRGVNIAVTMAVYYRGCLNSHWGTKCMRLTPVYGRPWDAVFLRDEVNRWMDCRQILCLEIKRHGAFRQMSTCKTCVCPAETPLILIFSNAPTFLNSHPSIAKLCAGFECRWVASRDVYNQLHRPESDIEDIHSTHIIKYNLKEARTF
jgi:hypothetical protein